MNLLWELYWSFFRIGILTFGGGLTMLPMLKREVVDKHEWITEEEMLDIYAIGQCTPGIIAVNTATFIGYKKKGISGGIFATLGEVTPSLLIITVIAWALSGYMEHPMVISAFAGIRVVVCALLFQTVIMLLKKNVSNKIAGLLFLLAMTVILFTSVSTIFIVVGGGVMGILLAAMENSKKEVD